MKEELWLIYYVFYQEAYRRRNIIVPNYMKTKTMNND